jgi:hypothetical protein
LEPGSINPQVFKGHLNYLILGNAKFPNRGWADARGYGY